MKRFVLILLFLPLYTAYLNGQEGKSKDVVYRAWVKFMSDPAPNLSSFNWDLLEVKDSSLLISQVSNISDYKLGSFTSTEIYFDQIEVIKVRRRNSIGRGGLIGLGVGVVIGITAGIIAGDDPPCPANRSWIDVCYSVSAGEKALAMGYGFGALGGLAGLVIGSARIAIPINGDMGYFNYNKDRLRKYSIHH